MVKDLWLQVMDAKARVRAYRRPGCRPGGEFFASRDAGGADQRGFGSALVLRAREERGLGRPAANRLAARGVFRALFAGLDAYLPFPSRGCDERHWNAQGGHDAFTDAFWPFRRRRRPQRPPEALGRRTR